MDREKTAKLYLKYLSDGDTSKIVSLFSDDATVDSPLFGLMKVFDFYEKLAEISNQSKLQLKEIFNSKDSNNLVIYFNYQWILNNGSSTSFDVIDILEFDDSNKILKLKIIYDTQATRALI